MILSLALTVLATTVPRSSGEENYTLAAGLELYTNLDDLLNFFRNHSSSLAKGILRSFEKDCRYEHEPSFTDATRKPFIVIVGNHRETRAAVGTRLAQSMAARYMTYPAPCLHRYIAELPKGTPLRRAFYFLSNYASAFYAKIQLSLDKAVVLNGYYHEQLSYALTSCFPFDAMPPISSDLYRFPEDLLIPNLIFFINLPDRLAYKNVRTREPSHWKPRTVDLYTRLADRYPIVVQDAARFPRETVRAMYHYIQNHLYHRRGVWFHDRLNNSSTGYDPQKSMPSYT